MGQINPGGLEDVQHIDQRTGPVIGGKHQGTLVLATRLGFTLRQDQEARHIADMVFDFLEQARHTVNLAGQAAANRRTAASRRGIEIGPNLPYGRGGAFHWHALDQRILGGQPISTLGKGFAPGINSPHVVRRAVGQQAEMHRQLNFAVDLDLLVKLEERIERISNPAAKAVFNRHQPIIHMLSRDFLEDSFNRMQVFVVNTGTKMTAGGEVAVGADRTEVANALGRFQSETAAHDLPIDGLQRLVADGSGILARDSPQHVCFAMR